MKTLLFCLILASLTSGSLAVLGPEKVKCPIMKDRTIDVDEATKKKLYIDYKGKRYYVCCKTCVNLFKRNPQKYADGSKVPVPSQK